MRYIICSMTRIEPLPPPYSNDVEKTLQRLMPPGMEPLRLFRTVAHNPRVLSRMHRGGLLDRGSISVRQRELAILRTCALCGAEYEWGVHARIFGAQAELDESALRAIANDPGSVAWAPDERAIIALMDTLHARATIDDALFEELRRHFDEAQILELTMLAGLYHAVSYVVNVAGVENESWAPRWSPSRELPSEELAPDR